jgi:hypothetical protein
MGVVKVLAVLMGVLIIIGSTVVVVTIIKRTTTTTESNDAGAAVVLDEPAGTRIGGIAAVSNRLAVLLQGAGPDRIVLVDPSTGKEAGTIALAR